MGLQINFSCPNIGLDTEGLANEVTKALDVAQNLGIPLMPKFSVITHDPKIVASIAEHPACDAICVSNTIQWHRLPAIDRIALFGSLDSPLKRYGGGGLSGRYLLPHVLRWIGEAHKAGLQKPINGGGGIMSLADARRMMAAVGENGSIFLGSISFMRPWRVAKIIQTFA